MKRTRLFLAAATIVAVAMPYAAAAQDTGDGSAAPADQSDDASSSSGPIADIVVTAERQSQSLQRTPAAVTSVTSEELTSRGITDMKRLSLLVPSTRFSVETNVVQVFLRGVGSQIDSPFVPEPVATNFNDVYLPRFVTGTGIFDIDRIEVLPGPQGTLYGRNALGGVVNIHAKMPGRDWGADFTIEAGNYNSTHITGAVNAPLGPDLAVRVAANASDHGAYFTNGTDTEHARAVRASVLYTPGDLSVYLWGSYYWNNNRPQATSYIPYLDPDNPWNQPVKDPLSARFYPPDGYDLGNLFGRYRAALFGGRIDWDIGGSGTTLSYIPSYIEYKLRDIRGLQGLPGAVEAKVKQTTHELRLASDPANRLSYLLGLYYYNNDTFWHAVLGPNLGGYRVPNVAEGEAIYGQLKYRLSDAVRATAGARYSWDREDADDAATVFPASFTPPTEGLIPFQAHPRWKHFDYKLGLEIDVAPRSMLYGSIQSGYAPGGYQAVQPVAGQRLPAQTMTGASLGMKNRFLDGTLQLNTEFFYYDYKNYVITIQSGASSISFGVPKTRIYGNQTDVIIAPSDNTQFNVGLGLLSAKIRKLTSNGVDYHGYQLPFSPSVTVSAGVRQTFDLSNGGAITLRADTHFESGYWGVFSHTSGLRQEGFTKTDASIGYAPASRNWDISLWVRNIENQATFAATAETPYPAPFEGAAFLESPRTYGVRFHVKFGNP